MLSFVAVDAVMDRLVGILPEELDALPSWLPPGLATDLRTGLLKSAYPRVVGMLDDFLVELQHRFPSLVGRATGIGLVRGLTMFGEDGCPSGQTAARIADLVDLSRSQGRAPRAAGPDPALPLRSRRGRAGCSLTRP